MPMPTTVSRRAFVAGSACAAAAVAAAGLATNAAPVLADQVSDAAQASPDTVYAAAASPAAKQENLECDIVVVGSGIEIGRAHV